MNAHAQVTKPKSPVAVGSAPARGGVPLIVLDVLRSPGQPLDAATRGFMQPRFGHDFSRVRVHADARAAGSARAVNALAYAAGSHVVFGSGLPAPSRPAGRRLLAHELAHVVQQDEPEAAAFAPDRIQQADDPAETEASRAADAALAGRPLMMSSRGRRTIARQTRTEDVQTLSDDALESEHEQAQQWLLAHGPGSAGYAETSAYMTQLEAEVARRNPSRIRAEARRQTEKRVVEGSVAASALFGPLGLSAAEGVFVYEFAQGVSDGLAEQPSERGRRIHERFRQLNGWGHWGDKADYVLGYLQGIALGIWGEIKGIVDLFLLGPRLLGRAIEWLRGLQNPVNLLMRALDLQARVNRLTTRAIGELVDFFEAPRQALQTLATALEGTISAGLGRAYGLGQEAMGSAMQFAEGPFRDIGLALGKAVGWALFQLALLLGTEAIGNLITRGAAIASRVLRGLLEGAATLFAEAGAWLETAITAVRGLVGNALMKAFRGTCTALVDLWEGVKTFFADLVRVPEGAGSLRPAVVGGGEPPPNVFMSEAGNAGGPVPGRSTTTTLDELYGRGESGGGSGGTPPPRHTSSFTSEEVAGEFEDVQQAGTERGRAGLRDQRSAHVPEDEAAELGGNRRMSEQGEYGEAPERASAGTYTHENIETLQRPDAQRFIRELAGQTDRPIFSEHIPDNLVPEYTIEHPVLPAGRRPRIDRLWRTGETIFELKPNNAAAEAAGEAQARVYAEWMDRFEPLPGGRRWQYRVVTYDQELMLEFLRNLR